jgi:hypothetical protein
MEDDVADARATDDEDRASERGGDECTAADSDDGIMDETIRPSPMKNRTRSKSRKVSLPEPLMCSDSEDELSRPQPRKRNRASSAPFRAGENSKYFRRNPNQFPSIASKKLAERKSTAGGSARK